MTINQFLTANNVSLTSNWISERPDGLMSDSPMNHYKCVLRCSGRQFTLYFSMGIGLTGEPSAADVLDCLASDAASYENASGFEDWASEFGYDTDSRKAEKIYRTTKRQSEQLKRLLGSEAYEQLLWNTERQ